MFSYWEKKTFYYHRDLIVCGAGFTGLSAAIYFKRIRPGKNVLVLERDPICGGASTKNAGFACFGSPSELLADLRKSDAAEVFGLVAERIRGLRNVRELLGDKAIGYEPSHGFELFRFSDPLFPECANKLDYLNEQVRQVSGEKMYSIADEKIATFGYNGVEHMIENSGEGQVDTGRMYHALLQLARETGVEIFNGIRVKSFADNGIVQVQTSAGEITADRFLIATNGFTSQLLEGSRTEPARAQVLITSPVKNLRVNGSFHMDEGFYYFRNIDGRVLFGGGRNLDIEGETTTEPGVSDRIQQKLESILAEIILPLSEYTIERRWSGVMGVGKEKQVIRNQLSPHVFCTIRLSGMGLALSTLLGKEVAEIM